MISMVTGMGPEQGVIKMYAGEVSVGDMTVFGVPISTRHGKAYELAEMINFCIEVQSIGYEKRVTSVFYDSNSCCCYFKLCLTVDPYDDVDDALKEAASKTISQFEWNETVCHGEPHPGYKISSSGFC